MFRLGNILDCRGRLLVVNPSTSDQYPVGRQLGPKMGGARGTNLLHNHGISSSIPLTGPVNSYHCGKQIAVLRQDGKACATAFK